MNIGDTASYSPVVLHTLGKTRVTFECIDTYSGENRDGEPLSQWAFEVTFDCDGITGGPTAYVMVSIIDRTEARIPSPFYDWDECHEVVARTIDTYDRDEHFHENFTVGGTVFQYSTERETIAGALFYTLEEIHLIAPSWPVCQKDDCTDGVASRGATYCSLEHEVAVEGYQ